MSETTDLGILDLLELFGFDCSSRSKLVRHVFSPTNPEHQLAGDRLDADDLSRRGWLNAYQSFQSKPEFDDLDSVVSFVALPPTRARLVGVFDINGKRSGADGDVPPGCPYGEHWQTLDHYYEMEQRAGFEALEHRVVIDWGGGTRRWCQKLKNKPVLEVLPRGQLRAAFSDYLDFTLTHQELEHLFAHPEANREWRARLSAVNGVYLILATTIGQQYVGSAHGADGIWGRWADYAQNGHGGNAQLRQLVKDDPSYPASFTYSVLQILPRTVTRDEVLRWERVHKKKLGTRATGLNTN